MTSPAANDVEVTTAATDLRATAWRRGWDYLVGAAWVINIGLLLTAFGWIYFFGQARETIELMRYQIGAPRAGSGIVVRDASRVSRGVTLGIAAGVVAAGAAVLMLVSLFAGGSRFRTTRWWLVLTAVVCGWLGLAMSWPAIYWLGQQQRVKRSLPAAEEMVDQLRKGWPTEDAALPDIGPFLAYPTDHPTALLALSNATLPNGGLRFSAVERTGDDVMRFELAGSEQGAWLEWRGKGSEPTEFVGGLGTKYVVTKVAKLAADWYLVRYRAAGLAE